MNNLMQSWSKNRIFKNLSQEELEIVRKYSREKRVDKGDYILREGSQGRELYIIEEGNVEILKSDIDQQEYQINTLAQGQVFGEMILFGKNERTASVRSLQPVIVQEILMSDLEARHPEIVAKISTNFSKYFAARMEESNLMSILALKKLALHRKKLDTMSRLMVIIFGVLLSYQLIMRIFINFTNINELRATTLVDIPLIIVIAIGTFFWIKKEGYPISLCGVTTRNWKKSIIESVLMTIPIILCILLVKWILIETVPKFAGMSVFQKNYGVKSSFFNQPSLSYVKASMILYLISAPFQEFIFRGIIQGALQRLFIGRRRIFLAILVSNLIFAAAHEPLSWLYPILVFIPGLFWGWLYMRHRTLIGVSISHLILGFWVLHYVGIGL